MTIVRRSGLLVAALVFMAAAFLYHAPAVFLGLVPTEDDLEVFFFPLLVATSDALHQGRLPLWTPLIFGGYPLFADGEAGMLYPLNLMILPWTSPEQALVWLRVIHSVLASGFTFVLARTLGSGVLGSTVGGLTYGYSGFVAGQIIHEDVIRAMTWLPLELALVVRMCDAAGIVRWRYACLAGAVFGIQALALHVHITLLSALLVTGYVAYRWLLFLLLPRARGEGIAASQRGTASTEGRAEGTGPLPVAGLSPGSGPLARGVMGILGWLWDSVSLWSAFALMGLLGIGLGAVQLIPLAELATESYRGAGLARELAAPNSVWPGDLLTLFLPHLHDIGTRDFWGPWVKWETVLYVGVLPLLLAIFGIARGTGRHRPFFLLVAGVSLLLAFGSYGPVPLWDILHALPGFNVLQSPGRFSLLFSLAVAIGAANGVDWLARRRASIRRAALVCLASAAVVALVAAGLTMASSRLEAWASSGSWLIEEYLRMPGVPRNVGGESFTVQRAARFAAAALSPNDSRTAAQLALLLAVGLVGSLWFLGRRFRLAAGALTVAVLFADLWLNGVTFHPYVRIGDLRPEVPEVLRQANGGIFRVLTIPTGDKSLSVYPNRLMSGGVAEASGYSSLPPDREMSYLRTVLQTDDDLLNLWNVRFVLIDRRVPPQPGYQGVSFHPNRPLFLGKESAKSMTKAFVPDDGPAFANEVRVVAAIRGGASLRDDEEVGRITLQGADSEVRVIPLLAGRHVSDATIDVPGEGPFAHSTAPVAFDHQRSTPDGDHYAEQIFYAGLPLDPPVVITRATVAQTSRAGRLALYGLGSFDPNTREVTQIRNPEDLTLVYQDARFRIFENRRVLPRAFLVHELEVLPPGVDPLIRMHEGPFDPGEVAILEEAIPGDVGEPAAPSRPGVPGTGGRAEIEQYAGERVVVRTNSAEAALLVLTDAYYPGWVARINGRPTEILPVDYLFRGVAVPAGRHEVVFSYEPTSIGLGLVITLMAALVVTAFAPFELIRARSNSSERRETHVVLPGDQ